MNNKDFLDKEREVLRQIPHDEVGDFIERNGQRMRDILEQEDQERAKEEIETLTRDYVGL